MPKVELISITPDYDKLLCTACNAPYGSNMSMKTVAKIIQAGHLSVLEHCSASFLIKCSVRVLGQITRHRHLSFTCQSARGKQFDTFVVPKAVYTFAEKHGATVDEAAGNEETFRGYREALEAGLALEDAAYWLPQGAETTIVVTGNFRAWFEYLPKRMCLRAMPEHRELACLIQKALAEAAPEIFDRQFMNCNKGCTELSCSFHGGAKKKDD